MHTDDLNAARRRIDAGIPLDPATADRLLSYAERLRVRLLTAQEYRAEGDALGVAACLSGGVL